MEPDSKAAGWNPEASPGFWMNRASRAFQRRLDACLRDYGFALAQLPVLRALYEHRALPQRVLADLARIEQPSMTEMLARMERDGVVEREANPDDKREKLISLTRRARAQIPKAQVALMEVEHGALRGLSAEERVVLRDLLQRVSKNVEASPQEAREAS